MVERLNRNLKLVIHTTYADGQVPEEEVNKYIASYMSTPHSVTGQTPNKLMFNREIDSKLPGIPTKPQGTTAKRPDRKTRPPKTSKVRYDQKLRAHQQDLQVGDLVNRSYKKPSMRRGPWEPEPHRITKVVYNQVTGTRDSTTSLRDRETGSWSKPDRRTYNTPAESRVTPPQHFRKRV